MTKQENAIKLLMLLKDPTPRQIDLSGIPESEVEDALEYLSALIAFQKGLGPKSAKIAPTRLTRSDSEALQRMVEQFDAAESKKQVSVTRDSAGRTRLNLGSKAESGGAKTKSVKTKQVKVKFYWWGVRVHLYHELVTVIATAGATAAGILAAAGVPAWVAPFILIAVAVLKAFDQGKGIYFYCTWPGVWWILPA